MKKVLLFSMLLMATMTATAQEIELNEQGAFAGCGVKVGTFLNNLKNNSDLAQRMKNFSYLCTVKILVRQVDVAKHRRHFSFAPRKYKRP